MNIDDEESTGSEDDSNSGWKYYWNQLGFIVFILQFKVLVNPND